MLSKQQKLRYGQILRQQMKEREEKKKLEQMEKRGNTRQTLPMREQPTYHSPQITQKQNSYTRPYIDPKEQLQKKLESQNYNPFGGLGGGAPNRKVEQNPVNMRNMSQPNQVRMPAEQMMQYSNQNYQNPYNNLPPQRVRTISEENTNYPPQYQPMQMQSVSPQSINYARQPQSMYYQESTIPSLPQQRMQNPYQQQQILNSNRDYPPYSNNYGVGRQQLSRQQLSFDNFPANTKQINSRIEEYPPNSQMMQQSYQPNPNQFQPMMQSKPMQQQQSFIPQMEQSQPYDQQINDNANQELHEVYKKGGRNLLKLQNQTIDEHLIKQKRKQQIQKQLKQQIEEAQRRKRQQKQKLKRQQQLEERRHLEYLAEQKRRVEEQQRKKRQQKQRIIDQNIRNLQEKKKLQQEAKRKAQQQRLQKQRKVKQAQMQKEQQLKRQQQHERKKSTSINQATTIQQSRNVAKNTITQDDNTSVVSSQTTSDLQKGFNTALSKEFFRKQREKSNPSNYQNKKLQQFSDQIQQINHQMLHQRQLMERQIEIMRSEAQKAKTDKKKAQQEIQKLKRQLKKKMQDQNQKLLRALQGNDFRNNDYHQLPPQHYKNLNNYELPVSNPTQSQNQYPSFGKKPLKQRQNQNLVKRQFEVQPPKFIPHQEQLSQFQQSHVGAMISLDGDSKKIPVYLEHSDKLTMSQVENFAKDSSFFQKIGTNKNSSPVKQKYNMRIGESIAQEPQQERDYNQSRKSNRNKPQKKESTIFRQEKDELDKLIDSRAKSRGGWGQMSSVNSDITKEIEELLRKKENPIGVNNGRPSSISNAGRQTLSKQGYAYDGLTLNSNVGGGTLNTNGTVDLQRINGRNDARLRELKNLGVETINTNGDDDLNALDQLLNKYK